MKYNQGFIALTSVLILSAISLSISISVASRAISGSGISIAMRERDTAKYLTESCVEHALIELERTLNYQGNESILVGDELCDILVVEGSGNTNRTIKAQGSVGQHTYRVRVIINTISPNLTIKSYKRVANF